MGAPARTIPAVGLAESIGIGPARISPGPLESPRMRENDRLKTEADVFAAGTAAARRLDAIAPPAPTDTTGRAASRGPLWGASSAQARAYLRGKNAR